MTVTTVKVSIELRDHLKRQAREADRTLGEHIGYLARCADRAAFYDRLRSQVAATEAESMGEYWQDLERWEAAADVGSWDWEGPPPDASR